MYPADRDAYGLDIFAILKYGSKALAFESLDLDSRCSRNVSRPLRQPPARGRPRLQGGHCTSGVECFAGRSRTLLARRSCADDRDVEARLAGSDSVRMKQGRSADEARRISVLPQPPFSRRFAL